MSDESCNPQPLGFRENREPVVAPAARRYFFDIKPAGDSDASLARTFRVKAAGWDDAVRLAREEAGGLFGVKPWRVWIVRGGEEEASDATDAGKLAPAGYFRGDWCDELDEMYPAVAFGRPWNGWAVPYVSAEVAQRIVAKQAELFAGSGNDDEQDRLEWDADGNKIVHWWPASAVDPGECGYEVVEAGEDGTYCVSFDWCWSRCDADGNWVRE